MEHTYDRIRKDWSFSLLGRFQQFWETSIRWPSMNIYGYVLDNGCVDGQMDSQTLWKTRLQVGGKMP